ncbi:amelogenin, X isoform-like [Pseudophryne corroboree]|uniref:amelogenin, X isoform-like n=1 Tax=Pseudophryne corroboree TaxID=495146 RepID=UPI003081BA10
MMKSWITLSSLLGAAFCLPLPPHSQHPGYVNLSYEILTPLKRYQSMMKHQYPSYGYEPMSGWLQNPLVPLPPMMPQQQLPLPHALPKLPPRQPILLPHQPMVPVHPYRPTLPLSPPQTNPTYWANTESQYPTNTQPIELPKPDVSNQPDQPLFPIQSQPPLVEEKPHDSWQPASKGKQEELVKIT